MITRKQKVRTVILVIVLVLLIIAGVFGISYYMNGYTSPFVKRQAVETEEAEQEVDTAQEENITVTVVEPEKEEVKETEETEVKADTKEEEEAPVVNTDLEPVSESYGYFGKLSVDGTSLVDEDGDPVQLVGVSSHGLSWYPEFITEDSIKFLKNGLGLNVVRLAVYTSDYDGYCVSDDENREAIKEKIDEAINACVDNDMYVILDWHILNDSDPNEYKSYAIQFFGEMVRKYEKTDNVIYEICNEPNGDTTWEDIKSYANEVIPVIREVNKDAVILVGTPEYCQDLTDVIASPLEFDNIMYTYHFYAATHKAKYRNRLMDAVDGGLPVFISECAFCQADGDGAIDEKEALNWVEVIDEYNLSACLWNLSNKDETCALISSDCDKLTDWNLEDLSEEGQSVYNLVKEYNEENDN